MQFSELPQEWQESLLADRKKLKERNVDTPYNVVRYNADGTRYFRARRCCRSWNDDKGNYMPFGGGSYWTVRYGQVQFKKVRNVMGQTEWELCEGKTFPKSANGTEIPREVATKKEVMDILCQIGIFQV